MYCEHMFLLADQHSIWGQNVNPICVCLREPLALLIKRKLMSIRGAESKKNTTHMPQFHLDSKLGTSSL